MIMEEDLEDPFRAATTKIDGERYKIVR